MIINFIKKIIMKKRAELYKDCHVELGRLYNCRQLPFINTSVENQLKYDKAVIKNGLFASITADGETMFFKKHYLKMAEMEENKQRESELREQIIRYNQIAVNHEMEQTIYNKKMFAIQIIELCISLIELIIGVITYCTQ